ncbi:hypothetical protein [Methanoculleus chikugoensis]|uniref:hypothetical protein n=1 Tax=Methanoculleus chikugoensis TaxID=118126 RepID=UPI001FB3AC45|nr:hypothetical protein [Methanoculleus chikugoensis]
MKIVTSAGIDWVVEYVDEDGNLHKVNNKGMLEPETVEVAARGGGLVYVKVYPMSYNDSGTVQVSASNADAVRVSQTAPGLFGGDATPTLRRPRRSLLLSHSSRFLPLSSRAGGDEQPFFVR